MLSCQSVLHGDREAPLPYVKTPFHRQPAHAITELDSTPMPLTQPGPRGILNAMVYGPRAARLAAMDPEERLAFVVSETLKVHPRLAEYYEGGTSYSRTNDRWSLGGHVYFKPGQMREFFPHIQRPEGRIHFAGDWVGGIPGYLHGALISAHTVVHTIEQA